MPRSSSRSADALRARATEPIDGALLYQKLHAAGLQYGPHFRLIRDSTCSSSGKKPLAQARLPITSQHTGEFCAVCVCVCVVSRLPVMKLCTVNCCHANRENACVPHLHTRAPH